MKKFHLLTLFVACSVASQAQQLSVSSFYEMNPTLYNASTAGSNHYGSIGGTFRTQWDGMPGGPQTGIVFGNTYLSKSHLGVGAYLYSDVTGPTKRIGGDVQVAYHIPVGNNGGDFSLGLDGRVQQWSYDRAKLAASLGANDPAIMGDDNAIKGDAGFGVSYTNKKFQIGASVAQLVQSKLNFYTGNLSRSEEAKQYRHYYAHAYYKWDVDQNTKIIPNAVFIYLPNAPSEFQGGVRIEHNNLFWYGLTWRVEQSWMLSAGIRLKGRFNLGYSFDIYTTPLSIYDKGSNGHEVMLRYDFIK